MISNFRDLGGIQNASGQIIPTGMLFRSANLAAATPKELTGISTVIDLRTETERQRMPDQVPESIAYHHIPIFDEATAGITREMSLTSVPDMVALYRQMEESCQDAISQVLTLIQTHDFSTGAVLWHCTAGKDRCGVITAHVLTALGVDQDTIMSDYMLSNESCIPEADAMISQLKLRGIGDADLQGIRDAFVAKEKYLLSALSVMQQEESREFQSVIFG